MSKSIRILCTLALTFATVGPVSAATIGGPVLVAQVTSATVTGRITDSQTGGPVANAAITLKGPSTYHATSDANGGFSISNVTPGIYSVSITKTGYNALTQDTLAVLAGGTPNIVATLQPITFTTLRTIASVRSTGRGTFNVTPASVNVVTAQTIQEQGQQQVMNLLNQTPGIVASYPSSSANGAAPGSITFPDIRGALSFETASLVDGHPVSVGSFGDYVSTFIPAFMLGDIEVVKGPGVEAPNVNYAIGGTVNYTTHEPTYAPQGLIALGVDNRGGSLVHFLFSGTAGRLGYVVGFSNDNVGSALNGQNAIISPSNGTVGILNWNGTTGRSLAFNDTATAFPGTISTSFTNFNLLACCEQIQDVYQNKAVLTKLRYKLSPVSSLTFTYLGAQSYANQDANTGDIAFGSFFGTPSGSYVGPMVNNTFQPVVFARPGRQREVQNEPIIQGDFRTSWNNDTLLARYYAAGIHRLLFEGSDAPNIPEQLGLQLFGNDQSTGQTFNGQTVPVTFFNYFDQAEDDRLFGYSVEWTHPFSPIDTLTVAVDQTSSSTVSYSVGSVSTSANANVNISTFNTPNFSLTIPAGSSQLFSTAMMRYQRQLSSKWNVNAAGYYNIYNSTYPTQSVNGGTGTAACQFNGANCVFATSIHNHWDGRLAFEYRPNANVALRASLGSAIAPPYLQLLSGLAGTISFSSTTNTATQRINTGGLFPETAFGYDVGGDWRLPDGATTVSGDVYLTNLWNHFLTYTYDSGTLCPATDPVRGTPTGCNANTELFYTSNRNLANARFMGVELSIRRRPTVGWGYTINAALQRAYAYNLPKCFYSTDIDPTTHQIDCTHFNTNLAIIPNQNFTGNGLSSSCNLATPGCFPTGTTNTGTNANGPTYACGCNGFSNHAIPYSQGYLEANYRFSGGSSVYAGATYLGNNNSLMVPAFFYYSAGGTVALHNGLSFQVNGFNITNKYSGVWPNFGGGTPIPIAGMPPVTCNAPGCVAKWPDGTPIVTGQPARGPQFAGTWGQVLGPARWQFQLTKRFGPGVTP